jgi:hypothetical protein
VVLNNPEEVPPDATPVLYENENETVFFGQIFSKSCPQSTIFTIHLYLLRFLSPPTCDKDSDFGDEPMLVKNPGNTVRLSWNVRLCDFVVASEADNFVSSF